MARRTDRPPTVAFADGTRVRRALRRFAGLGPVRRVRHLASAPRSADGVMLVLGAVVGLGTGLLAVLLIEVIRTIGLVAFSAPTRLGVVVATTVGGLLVGILVTHWVPEARGGGVTQVMESIALHGGRIRPTVAFGKLLTAGVSLGTGAAGGREGPIVQIGGAVGSTLGRAFALDEEQKRALIAAGAAAGIAASFNAPISGMLFAVEIIIGGFRLRYLQVVVVASVVASVTARQIVGEALIYNPPNYGLGDPAELGFYVLIGIVAALAGYTLVHGVNRAALLLGRLRVWPPLRTALAGLLLGLLALGLPEVLGTGETLPPLPGATTTQPIGEMLAGTLGGTGLAAAGFLLLLALGKLAAAVVTLAGGYAAGPIAPSIFIGAALGGAVGHVADVLLETAVEPGALAVAGMAAVMASANRAPLTAILIAFELTGGYDMVVPLMLSVGIATLLSERLTGASIYTVSLLRRGIVYGEPEDVDIMQTVRVGEIMTADPDTVPATMSLEELNQEFRRTRHHGFPVVADGNRLVGVVTLGDLTRAAGDHTADLMAQPTDVRNLTVADICTRRVLTVTPADPVFRAVRRMATIDVGRLPVVAEEDHGRLVGLVRRADVVKAYQRAVTRSVGAQQRSAASQLRDLTGTQLVEVVIGEGSAAAGREVREVRWPPRTILTSIRRQGDVVLPNGTTVLEPGDDVVALTAVEGVDLVRELLAGHGPDAM